MTFRFAYTLLLFTGKRIIVRQKGRAYYSKLKTIADGKLKEIESLLREIKGSGFDSNYYFVNGYTEWAPEKGFITRK